MSHVRQFIWVGLVVALVVLAVQHAPTVGQRMPGTETRHTRLIVAAVHAIGQESRRDGGSYTGVVASVPDVSALIDDAYETARTDPVTAIRLAVELPAGPAQTDLLRHAAAQWAATDPAAAADWAEQIDNPALREPVLMCIATVWGDRDPVAAATLALTMLPAGRHQEDAVIGIVQRWAQHDADAATAWVAEFPPGPLRATAEDNLAKLATASHSGD